MNSIYFLCCILFHSPQKAFSEIRGLSKEISNMEGICLKSVDSYGISFDLLAGISLYFITFVCSIEEIPKKCG